MGLELQADTRRKAVRRGPIRRRRAHPQVRVSFSGLDGAGKSSQIEALLAELGEEQRSAQVLWLPYHFWPTRAKAVVPTRVLRRLYTKDSRRSRAKAAEPPRHESRETAQPERPESAPASAGRGSNGTRKKALSGLRSGAMSVAGTVAALSAGMSLRQRMSEADVDVLVLDRYVLDSLVKLRYAFPDLPQSWLSRVIRSIAPKPDVELLFQVDPEVAYARKPAQWNVRQLTAQARLYDDLATSAPTVVTIDASREPEDLAREVWALVRPLLDGPRHGQRHGQ